MSVVYCLAAGMAVMGAVVMLIGVLVYRRAARFVEDDKMLAAGSLMLTGLILFIASAGIAITHHYGV